MSSAQNIHSHLNWLYSLCNWARAEAVMMKARTSHRWTWILKKQADRRQLLEEQARQRKEVWRHLKGWMFSLATCGACLPTLTDDDWLPLFPQAKRATLTISTITILPTASRLDFRDAKDRLHRTTGLTRTMLSNDTILQISTGITMLCCTNT